MFDDDGDDDDAISLTIPDGTSPTVYQLRKILGEIDTESSRSTSGTGILRHLLYKLYNLFVDRLTQSVVKEFFRLGGPFRLQLLIERHMDDEKIVHRTASIWRRITKKLQLMAKKVIES